MLRVEDCEVELTTLDELLERGVQDQRLNIGPGSISASPTACLTHGCRRAGTQNDRLGKSFPTVQGTSPARVYTHVYTHVCASVHMRVYARVDERLEHGVRIRRLDTRRSFQTTATACL